ncbi:MAG: DUF3783 domain-containing protein [Verrucomicrobia bacterium]|nr:DUF3783 domain-containing protein [Verrucomicrobiota bacterium]
MPENTGTFQPLDQADRAMHGPQALLVCGHAPDEEATLYQAWLHVDIAQVPIVFATARDADRQLGEIVAHATLRDGQAQLPLSTRAVVVAGVTQRVLHRVMQAHRDCGMPPTLWAALTPVNEAWTLHALLRELNREREALGEAMRRASAGEITPPRPSPK